MHGDIYESHIKKRTPSIILVMALQFLKLSKIIGMCKLNLAVYEIEFRKDFFFFCKHARVKVDFETELMKAESKMKWCEMERLRLGKYSSS